MKKMPRILSIACLSLLSIIAVFVFLEIAANVYLLNWADEDSFLLYASLNQLQERKEMSLPKFTSHRYLGYQLTPNYVRGENRHNSLGYRGEEITMPKPAGRFRIACIGGSTTYTSDIEDYKQSYPHLLERYLVSKGFKDVDVINAGANGWSSWESLINLELRVLDLEPDLIVVYHGVNDVHPRFVWPPEAYTGDNSGYRVPPLSEIFMPSIYEHSTLLRMLMIKAGITKPHSDFEATLDRHPETYYGVQFRKQKVNNSYPRGIFQEIDASRMLENNRPVYFERNIRNMVSVAKNWEIGVVISSFAYCPLFTEQPIASSEEYVASYKENNKLLKEIAEETGVHFIDFASMMPNDKRYFTDGRHLSEQGVQLKAKLFGDFIIDKYLVVAGGN